MKENNLVESSMRRDPAGKGVVTLLIPATLKSEERQLVVVQENQRVWWDHIVLEIWSGQQWRQNFMRSLNSPVPEHSIRGSHIAAEAAGYK